MEKGQTVRIVDVKSTKNDPFLEDNALKIIEGSDFTGEITKIEDGIHFVGFVTEDGWVTQGFKSDEIEVVK